MDDFAKRLSRLERENRLLKAAAVIAIVAIVVGAAKDSSYEKIIAAQEFALVDAQGKVRGDWRVDDKGGVHLIMSNKSGEGQLRLE